MTRPPGDSVDRLLDLLADQALDGLSTAETLELESLLSQAPEVSPDDLAAAAASLAVALEGADTRAMPEVLRVRVEADADRFLRNGRRSLTTGWKLTAASGWLAAAASWLVMAVASWSTDDPETLRAGATSIELKATEHPLARGARGEMVWSQPRQQGFLKLTGLAGVKPSEGAYQLWIFDDARDPRYPVDGGAFRLDDEQTSTIVPVRPGVSVGRPSLFAITLEPPGGVVVSDRRRILMTGEVPRGPSVK